MLKTPKYSLHKRSGQTRVRFIGKYLGPYGTPASRDAYDRIILHWRRINDITSQPSDEGVVVFDCELVVRNFFECRDRNPLVVQQRLNEKS